MSKLHTRALLIFSLVALLVPATAPAQTCPPAEETPEPVTLQGQGSTTLDEVIDGQANVVVGEGLLIEFPRSGNAAHLEVTIEWFKSSGTCATPTISGSEEFGEVGFALRRPDGQVLTLVEPGDWTSTDAEGPISFETTFLDGGDPLSIDSGPLSTVYAPSSGSMEALLDGASTGTWQLLATDTTVGAELCVYGWSMLFVSGAEHASWGTAPPALPPQGSTDWFGLETIDGVTESSVGDGLAISGLNERSPSDLRLSIIWTKTDGSCEVQTGGAAYHEELGLALRRPDGVIRQLIVPGTYSGNDDIGSIVTTFDDLALITPLGGRPVSGNFRAADGSLDELLNGPVDGTWQLLATDQGPGDPLCVEQWSLEIDHVTHVSGDVVPFAAGAFSELRELAIGPAHGLARGCDGTLWAWGENTHGEVGTGSLIAVSEPVELPTINLSAPGAIVVGTQSSERAERRIAVGSGHSLALEPGSLFTRSAVFSWGSGSAGQLGHGTFDDVSQPTQVALPLVAGTGLGQFAQPTQVAAGDLFSLALFDTGALVGWGDNHSAQLAVSGLYNVVTPIELSLLVPADFSPFFEPPQRLAFSSVEAGGAFNLATQSPQLCLGGSGGGSGGGDGFGDQVGFPGTNVCLQLEGVLTVAELGEPGMIWAWGDDSHGQMGQGDVNVHNGLAPVQVQGLPGDVVVSAGLDHALALDELTGTVFSWGNNDEGQLGRPTLTTLEQGTPDLVQGLPRIIAISAGAKFSVAVDEYGRVWGWGRNHVGQLAQPGGASTISPELLDLGPELACALAVEAGFESVVARDCGALCGYEADAGVPTAPGSGNGDPLGPEEPPTPPPGYGVDTDSDLLSDLIEGGQNTSPTDSDGGGLPDFQDSDSDNDGILDCFEAGDRYIDTPADDADGDGIPNFRDLDSDNDGIPDGLEGTADPDGDGLGNFVDTDSDGDGIPDAGENAGDLDGDGIPNSSDPDLDGDGIPNTIEGTADPDGDGAANEADLDSDGDGIADALETASDSDGDGLPNFLDLDSDADGIYDANEFGYDSNGDGQIEVAEQSPLIDVDGDGLANFLDSDSDADGIEDGSEGFADIDADGKPNFVDLDSDGDGIADDVEGVGDADGDGLANFIDADSDDDGLPDSIEGNADKDQDGLANFVDLDSDNDGISDAVAGPGDLDGDGVLNFLDPDADGDLIANLVEGEADLDGDGIPNFLDVDADGDLLPDVLEGVSDLDGDGLANYVDLDSDGDGVLDRVYATDGDANPIPPDLDNDGLANHLDDDADGDGISNDEEGFTDFDQDGLLNPLDFDADGDGIPDRIEGTGDADGDDRPDYLDADPNDGSESDPDGDSLRTSIEELYGLNPQNPDSDGDGISDGLEFAPASPSRDEGEPVDTDLDGVIDALDEDSDGDGWPDAAEAPLDPNNPPDSDGDGIYDFRDLDSDNDGLSDHEELLAGTSPVNGDSDGDGISDAEEVANGSDPMGGAILAQLVAGEGGCMSSVSAGQPRGVAALLAVVLLLGGLRRRRQRSSFRVGPTLLCLLLLGACDDAVEPPEVEPTAPRLSLSGDLEVDEGTFVSLEASAIDADGDIQTWQWQQTSGDEIELLVSDAPRAAFLAPTTTVSLELEFAVSVADSQGLSAEGQLSVTVLPVNEAPYVNAGSDQRVDEGATVLLEGVVDDADGAVADWSWSVLEGEGFELIEGEEFVAQFEAPSVESDLSVVLALQVTDDEGAVVSDQVHILVSPLQGAGSSNSPPVVDAGTDQQVDEGDLVALSASASDADGTIASLSWSQLSGPLVELLTETSLSTDFSAPEVLSETLLSFEVVATDSSGSSSSDRVDVLVADANQAPLVAAGPDQVVDGGDVVTLSGQAADTDGSITNIVWTQLSGTSVSLSSPYATGTSFVASSSATGETLTFRLLCQDDGGATSSDDVDIEVLPTNQPPVVSVGPDQSVLSGDVVQLTGSASDVDGSVLEVVWVQVAGQGVALSAPTSSSTQFTSASTALEVLSFTFSATDDDGAKAGATVHITVEAPAVVADPCCGALSPAGPGSALICQDLAAFSCVADGDDFCEFTEWDAFCAESYRGEGFFSFCPPAVTCN